MSNRASSIAALPKDQLVPRKIVWTMHRQSPNFITDSSDERNFIDMFIEERKGYPTTLAADRGK